MISWISKGGIGKSKLTKVEERIFGGGCRGANMHIQGRENEKAPTIL